jgi:hypothetical protein
MSGDVGFGGADEPCEAQVVGGCGLRLSTEPRHRGNQPGGLPVRGNQGAPPTGRAAHPDRHAGTTGNLGQLACSRHSIRQSQQQDQVTAVLAGQHEPVLEPRRQPSLYDAVLATADGNHHPVR